MTTAGPAGFDACGASNASFVVDAGSFLGSTAANGFGVYNDGSGIGLGTNPGLGTFTTGDVIGMALDVGSALAWFRKNGGLWNNNAGADPATGSSGASFTASGAIFPTVEGEHSGDVWTANFGGSAYANAAPSGFGNW